MSGKRLLDAANIYGVLRIVAKVHFALRSQQLDTFSKTSTVAKALKDQSDRVTVTASAAYALARKLNEDGPAYVRASGKQQRNVTNYSAYSSGGSGPASVVSSGRSGIDGIGGRDHDHIRADDNNPGRPDSNAQPGESFSQRLPAAAPGQAGSDAAHDGAINVTQAEAERNPLPDGTISAAETLARQAQGQDTFSKRPKSEPHKDPLQEQEGRHNLEPKESGASTIPDPTMRTEQKQQSQIAQLPSHTAAEEPAHTTQDTFVERSDKREKTSHTSLPQTTIPEHTQASEGDHRLPDSVTNQDVFYDRKPLQGRNEVAESTVPDDIDLNIFHSPRVAASLSSGGREDRRREYQRRMDASRSQAPEKPAVSTENSDHKDTFVNTAARPKQSETDDIEELARSLAAEVTEQPPIQKADDGSTKHALRESRVPSSRLGRIWQFSGLATGMALGAVSETFRRFSGSESGGSIMLSEANMERLVTKLSRMRGAALKLGQMMSFQDSKLLPPAINAVLQRVQDSADYMPTSQRDQVLAANLGTDWRSLFSDFSDVPIAAASIGQVHKATLASDGTEVAVKVQYPGVKNSIDSDLSNLSLLLTASRLLPKGLYLDKTIANARTELAWECDYVREADCGQKFSELVKDETAFEVPTVYTEASGPEVLTATFMHGTGVTKIPDSTQDERDWIGTQVLRLCLRELTEWRFMQTDPNWTNFLYNRQTKKLELLDFGASREFPDKFVNPYVELLIAASKGDRGTCREKSIELGYLTGAESKLMLDAHVDSILTLAEPFRQDIGGDGTYDFRDQTITDRVRAKIGLMVRERLAPPPEETYSLHRKLSGAFLLCARLGSRVGTKSMFDQAVSTWKAGLADGRSDA